MKRYPEYKRVDWIGEIPTHWEIKKIKHTQSNLVGGVWGEEPKENENDIYCIRVADFNYEQLTISTHNLTLRSIPLKENDKRILKNYDLLVEKSGGGEKSPVGKTVMFNAEISRQSVTSNFITKFTTKSDSYFPKYVLYCLCFFYHIGLTRKHIKQTTGIQNLDIDSYFQEKIPFPSLVEQRAIANFLDCKTEQIDELIRIKDRQIELLQEQRTALINQVVTKGLDPNVEMKPSGVEWVGEIPKHWEVRRNKRIFYERDDRSETGEEELLTVSHITGVSPRAEKKNVGMFLAETMEGYKHCSVGNLVINTMWAWMGALGVSSFDGIVSPSYNVYELKSSEYVPKYYDYLYRTPNHIQEIIRWSKGIWHSRWRLYPDAFFSMFAITPPFSEQVKIVDFLNRKNKQIDELITAEQRKIELLKEYRQSLISEAVTGKIDVRDEV